MKNAFLILAVLTSFAAQAADFDLLAQEQIIYKASQPLDVLNKTTTNLKSIFDKYKVRVDSGSRITSPLRVAGTAANPTIQVGIEKCVFIVCKQVDLKAVIGIKEVRGTCEHTYLMTVDLSRSTGVLAENYDRLDVGICYNSKNTDAQLLVNVSAHHARAYQQGQIQQEIYKLLKLQIPSLMDAFSKTLVENGGEVGID